MAKTEFVEFVIDLLQVCSPADGKIFYKRMFGGYGIFYPAGNKDLMFALIADDELYFKVNESNHEDYKSLDLPAFVYHKKGKPFQLSYFLVPEFLLDGQEDIKLWAYKAIEVALQAAKTS